MSIESMGYMPPQEAGTKSKDIASETTKAQPESFKSLLVRKKQLEAELEQLNRQIAETSASEDVSRVEAELREVEGKFERKIVETVQRLNEIVKGDLQNLADLNSALQTFIREYLEPLLGEYFDVDKPFINSRSKDLETVEININDAKNENSTLTLGIQTSFEYDPEYYTTDEDFKLKDLKFSPTKCAEELKALIEKGY